MTFNKSDYREFADWSSAHKWGLANYSDWIARLHKELPQSQDETSSIVHSYILATHDGGVSDILFGYTGSNNLDYNRILYDSIGDDYSADEKEELFKKIELINNELYKLSISENIVVYRFTRKEWFADQFRTGKPKNGETFNNKGFTSTTLVAESLLSFAKERRYNCMLKLYLPKGSKGAYIWYNDGLNEQEILLPTNTTFKLIKKGIWFRKLMPIYECILVGQPVKGSPLP